MVMFEQSRRLSEPLRWGRREKALVGLLASVAVVAIVALAAFGLSNGSSAAHGRCIDVTFASTLGGADLKGCGSQARRICASADDFHSIEHELQAACKRAGFPAES